MSKAKESIRRFLETIDKGHATEWTRKTQFIPQVEKDDFLALEGSLKNVDIERPIKELGKTWKK